MNKIVKFSAFALVQVLTVFGAFALKPINTGDALKDSVAMANRRTALRCLSLSSDYAASGNWNAVSSQVELGLSYDDSISDLWYLKALAFSNLKKPAANVLAFVETALENDNWASYNYDSARVLYADILSDTLRSQEVSAVLDKAPLVFSADAEYIRAKAYYRLGTPGSLEQARTKIDNARKIYPRDERFPLLFFKSESPENNDPAVRSEAQFFISQIKQYADAAPSKAADLEAYAAVFARGDERVRMLQSFNARGFRHPLYAKAALDSGLLTQEQAVSYIEDFSDSGIDYDILVQLVRSLTEDSAKEKMASYLLAFNGSILRDMDGDGIYNMSVKYSRGRPQTIIYDANQDQLYEWRVACDFGTPVSGTANPANMDFEYGEYPYLKNVSFRDLSGTVITSFELPAGSLSWTPVNLKADPVLTLSESLPFFFPELNVEDYNPQDFYKLGIVNPLQRGAVYPLPVEKLVKGSSVAIVPTRERKGAFIRFAVLDGKIQTGDYFYEGKLYAHSEFKNDIPSVRMVDSDGDGIFEMTEIYASDKDGSMDVHSMEDERNIIINMLGIKTASTPWYLKQVQVDTNKDSVPDFTEQYSSYGGKVLSWDTDGDGKWDVRYVRASRTKAQDGTDNPITEEAFFYDENKNQVHVVAKGGKPVSVKKGNIALDVHEDSLYKFYWIGKEGANELAKQVLTELNKQKSESIAVIVEYGGIRVKGIKIGENSYGMIIPPLN